METTVIFSVEVSSSFSLKFIVQTFHRKAFCQRFVHRKFIKHLLEEAAKADFNWIFKNRQKYILTAASLKSTLEQWLTCNIMESCMQNLFWVSILPVPPKKVNAFLFVVSHHGAKRRNWKYHPSIYPCMLRTR